MDFILKNKKININIKIYDKIDSYSYILTPLVIAARNDNKGIAEFLLSQPEIDDSIIRGKTNFLYEAVKIGNIEIIKLLLSNPKIDINMFSIHNHSHDPI